MLLLKKIRQVAKKLRLEPIRVFCLHHVCNKYNEDYMWLCDWISMQEFKIRIAHLKANGYKFISLTEAYQHLKNEKIRKKKYAVVTFDDGNRSLLEILPWLESQCIPATLFINCKYLDGVGYRDSPKEEYLTYDELFSLTSNLIEIGHHGWEHISVFKMSNEEFEKSIEQNMNILTKHPRYIPFWAYTYGHYTEMSNLSLIKMNIIPVVMDEKSNYSIDCYISRESILKNS